LRLLPTVTLAIGKREGANAVAVADRLLEQLETVRGELVPDNIAVHVTRNYGKSALEKADELLLHLAIATVSIVILIGLFVGWRESGVVLVIIPTTILLTFFASYLMDYTINRVSLFALIFSIGILVDDAIVVVENIVRHWRMKPGADLVKTAIEAVDEVGNPTIVATLTVIAALLPMMFVSGLMGPYMAPIPANASAAMLFSFFIAVMIAPWLLLKIGGGKHAAAGGENSHGHEGRMSRLYRKAARPVLKSKARSWAFLLIVGVATVAVTTMFATRAVTVKLLPFDNKSELQVIVDLPEGSSLEATQRVLIAATSELADLPELSHIQAYAGTAAPFNFNGLVRHYYLRAAPEMGDLQINITPKHERDRASHDIALDIRARLAGLDIPEGTSIKVVERTGCRNAPRIRRQGPRGLREGRFRGRYRRQLRPSDTAAAPVDRPGQSGVSRHRGRGGLRHHCGPVRRYQCRLFPSWRRRKPGGDRHPPAEIRPRPRRAATQHPGTGPRRHRRVG
jgi:multidrug efflux pump subunit AcrB